MGVGDTFSLQWGINWDTGAGNKGFSLFVGGTEVVNVNNGSSSAITFNGSNVGFNFGTTAMTWSFSYINPTTLSVSANDRDGSGTFSTNITVSGGVSAFRYYISGNNNGGNAEPFYNNLLSTNSGVFSMGGTVTNANTFTGSGSLSVGNNTTLALSGGGNNNYSGTTTISNGSTLRFQGSGTSGFGSAISGGGAIVVSNGSGQVNLSANNSSFSGNITITNGTVEAQNANALGDTTGTTTVGSGAALKLFNAGNMSMASEVLTLNGTGVNNNNGALRSVGGTNTWNGAISLGSNVRINADTTGGAGALTIAGNVTGGANVLFLGTDGANITLSGALSGGGASQDSTTTSIFKDGASTLTLSGNNSYTGDTRITSGNVTVAAGGNLGSGSDVFVSSGATLTVNTNTTVASLQETGNNNGGSATIGTGATLTVNGNAYNTFMNSIGGAGSLTKSGTGTMNLYGSQTYTGTTTVSGGVLSAGTNLASTNFSLTGGTLTTTADGAIVNSAAFSMSGGTLRVEANESFADNGLTLASGTSTVSVATANSLTANGGLTGSGNLTKAGGGVFVLSAAASSFSGATVLDAGTLRLGNNSALGTSALTINAGTLAASSSTARTIANNITMGGNAQFGDSTGTGALVLNGTMNLGASTRTLTVSNSTTLGGAVSGTGGLTKAGTGALTISANSSYSGATTINAGTLFFNATNTSTTTTVNSGGTLAGSGSLAGVTINSGGTMSPGNSPGTQTYSSLVWEGGGNYNWQIYDATGAAGTGYDTFSTGSFTINATSGNKFNINLWSLSGIGPDTNGSAINFSSTTSTNWALGTFTSITGFATDKFTINTGAANGTAGFANSFGGTFSISTNSTQLLLVYTAPVSNYTVTVASGAVDQGAGAGITGGTNQFTGAGASLTKLGAGTLIMTNSANDYTGSTTIAEGTVSINVAAPSGSAGALGNSIGAVSVGTSTNAVAAGFNFGAAVENARSLSIIAGNASGGTRAITTSFGSGTATQSGAVSIGTNTVITAASGSTLLISGALSGTAGLSINGSGVTVLSGNSTGFSGPITNGLNSTLRVGNNNGLGTGGLRLAGTFASDSAAARTLANNITMSGANVTFGDATGTGNLTLNGTVDLNGSTRTFTVANNTTIGGVISGSAGNGLTKAGSGTLTLSGINTFSGPLAVDAGQVTLANTSSNAVADTVAVTVGSGATLALSANLEEIGSLAGSGSVTLGSNLLIAGGNGTSTSYSGIMSGTGGFVKKGAGTITLSGANNYTGQTYIVGGTALYTVAQGASFTNVINIGEDNSSGAASVFAIGGSGLTFTNNINVRAGDSDSATIDAQNTTGTTTLNGTLTLAKNGDVRAAAGGGMLINGNISGAFALGKRGSGTVTIAGTTANDTRFDLWEGELAMSSAGNLGTSATAINNKIYFDGGTLGATGTFTSGANNGMFVGSGGANFRVAANQTLTVAGTIDNGATNAIAKRGTGTLVLSGTSNSGNNRYDLLEGELQVSASGNLGDKTGDFLANKLFFNGGALGVTGNVTLDGENGVTMGGNGTIRVATGNTLTLQGYINDQSLTGLTLSKTGSGTLFFDKGGVNDFSGTTIVVNEGVVSTYNPDLLSPTVQLGSATAATSGTYNFTKSDGGITAANAFTVNSGGGAISVTDNTLTVTNTLSGSGAFSKTGAGTLTLSGNNGYSGDLTVSAGTLQLNRTGGASLGSVDSITVNNTATLLVSQSNQVNNSAAEVTLSGGTISRGNGVSEVFGNLNVTAASFLNFGSGTAGSVKFGTYARDTESALLTVQNFFQGNSLVFSQNLVASGFIASSSSGSYNNGYFSFADGFTTSWNGTDTFTITAIPEPSTYLAAAGLLAMFLWPARRRLIKDAKSILGLRPTGRDRIESYRQT